jgi:hypothetical protein
MSASSAAPGGIDRLAASGAQGAAAAMAALLGGEPRAGRVFAPGPAELAGYATGVCFRLSGALRGSIAVLFGAGVAERLVRALGPAAARHPRSALCELANIAASQAVGAIAEGLGARVDLSVPRLSEAAGPEMARLLAPGETALASVLSASPDRAPLLLVLLPGVVPPDCDTVGA